MPKGVYPPKHTVQERLEKDALPVPFSGCLLWLGHTNPKGYGRINVNRRLILTHRLAWCIHRGPIPDGLYVLHSCDVRCCINPDHLFLGTQLENMRDMVSKGRRRDTKGSKNPNAKLSDDDVLYIRNSLEKTIKLAMRFNVDRHTIANIRNRKKRAAL